MSNPERPDDVDNPNPSITRRRFNSTVAAGGVYAAVHQVLGAAAAQSGRSELCEMTAVELAARLARKQVSAREVMTAHLAQIERVNPKVNAIVTLVAERAMAGAAKADEAIVRRDPIGVLHGLPVAHKDLVDTAGIRTTAGSPFYRDHVPTHDALIVTRIRAAGAITVGKTNTPEFGAGSQTFNTVFGATRNPYDLTKTCGGSSGGAATAVAARMLPIADGSDTGGSLRNPPAFCNVVGLRPSPGRVAERVHVVVAARRCPDRWRERSPTSRCFSARSPDRIRAVRCRSTRTRRVSGRRSGGTSRACASRGGAASAAFPSSRRSAASWTPIARSSRISAASSRRRSRTSPASTRRFRCCATPPNYPQYAPLVRQRPEWVKDTIKFEVAQAERATAADVGRALARQARMYDQSRQFFERYEYFILPVTQVEPFDVNTPYPDRDRGHADERPTSTGCGRAGT